MRDDTTITKSSGNIFADIGLPNPQEHAIKADIVLRIIQIVKARKLTQAQISKIIGLAQPDVSKLLRGHFSSYITCIFVPNLIPLVRKACETTACLLLPVTLWTRAGA